MIRLGNASTEVIVDVAAGSPSIAYWGAPLGDIDTASLVAALDRPLVGGSLDVVAPLAIVAEHGSGFAGRPGLLGHRPGGLAWSPRFSVSAADHDGQVATILLTDPIAALDLQLVVSLADVLAITATLTNRGPTRYLLEQLTLGVALADHAEELAWFTGRWTREFHEVRQPFTHGALSVENRIGRSSQDHVPTVFAGSTGFGEWHGDVWGLHLGASANHQMVAEVLPDGRRIIQFGELLHPGEVVLEPEQSYTTPTLYGSYSSSGMTPASWGFHRHLRARPSHPRTPRKVLVNTWEAVYFDHDLHTLKALADRAAQLGVERYVLDDGWFGSRRDDTSGLGDWVVSAAAHPGGLAPLIDHVRGLGMEFGIWVEPEMVNPDSDLYRAHPDWALVTEGYQAVLARNQLVLDLANPDAYAHIHDQLDRLLKDHPIGFLKWDMNRNHVQGSGADGAAGSHRQTMALYRLLDQLRAAHPGVEIESCSSGGGRVDFGILAHTDRVWTSDCNDPLERQRIQRGVSTFLAPELMGAHIGPPHSHTTGRTHSLAMRAATAMFGHLGIEWNLLDVDDSELAELAGWVALHRRFRELLHHGDAVRFDPVHSGPRPAGLANGVYAADRGEALISYAQMESGLSLVPPRLRLPGLDPDGRYEARLLEPSSVRGRGRQLPAWADGGVTLSGRQLAAHGVQLPSMDPETVVLVHLRGLDRGGR